MHWQINIQIQFCLENATEIQVENKQQSYGFASVGLFTTRNKQTQTNTTTNKHEHAQTPLLQFCKRWSVPDTTMNAAN